MTDDIHSTNEKHAALVSEKAEAARLAALYRYNISQEADNTLDLITASAAQLFGAPIALLDFIDGERIFAKSHFGTEVNEFPLMPGLCASAVKSNKVYVVENALSDVRTHNHPLVQGEHGVRFYAGAPLKTYDNHNIGVLCVLDYKPYSVNQAQLELLENLAKIAIGHIELTMHNARREEVLAIETKFKLSELQNKLILDSTAEGIHVIDLKGNIIVENQAAVKMLGWEQDDILGRPGHATLHHHHADHTEYFISECPIHQTLKDGISRQVSNEVFWRKDGSYFPVEYSTTALKDLSGNFCGTTVVFRDITARRVNETKLQQLAFYDVLTGLPNRTLFIERLNHQLNKALLDNSYIVLMFIDLDRFKEINDTMGHDVGDQLLAATAERLKNCVGKNAIVARLGGDEFTVMMYDLISLGSEKTVASAILKSLALPYTLNNEDIYLSASIGITNFPDDASNIEALLKTADQAMYAAKKSGKNRYHYFTASMQERANSRLRLVTDLHSGLSRNEFFLAYQPIVHLATAKVHKAEALIRWQHPSKGLISPAEFIPIAEEIGLIVEIGNWVLKQAMQQVAALIKQGLGPFQISINKSPVQFTATQKVHQDWFNYLAENGLTGEHLCVEITEGLLMDSSAEIKEKLLAFRDAGVQVSLDDFGTGYSSLSYLNKFSIDYLKIDQSFVHNLDENSDDYVLCEAMIMMAHKLNIQVIAEGVETKEQFELLRKAGCDYGQGYYFSKPLTKVDFEQYLELHSR